MKRWTAIAGALVIAIGLAAWWARDRMRNVLVVANASGQAVAELAITVGGETARFGNLPAGATARAPFAILSDDSFVVRGKLADGTVIDAECGYVTNGMCGERARFILEADGKVDFSQGQYEVLRRD